MKILLTALVLIALVSVESAYAQRNYPISIGPSLLLKAGVNAASIPESYKTGVAVSGLPDIGVSAYFPLGRSNPMGIVADLSYSTYAYGERRVFSDREGDLYKMQYSYLTLSPSFYISSFLLGLDFGIPLSGSQVTDDDSFDIETDNIATLVEVHLGGMFPIVDNKDSRVNILVRAGYMLTGIGADNDSEYNPKAATVGLGVNYYFHLR